VKEFATTHFNLLKQSYVDVFHELSLDLCSEQTCDRFPRIETSDRASSANPECQSPRLEASERGMYEYIRCRDQGLIETSISTRNEVGLEKFTAEKDGQ
jgi:hypothetical protein